jgi:hypothetical protein
MDSVFMTASENPDGLKSADVVSNVQQQINPAKRDSTGDVYTESRAESVTSSESSHFQTWRSFRKNEPTNRMQLTASCEDAERQNRQLQEVHQQQLEDKDAIIRALLAQRDQTFKELQHMQTKIDEKTHETWLLRGMLCIPTVQPKSGSVIVSHYPKMELRWANIALRSLPAYDPVGSYIIWRPADNSQFECRRGFLPLIISVLKSTGRDPATAISNTEAAKISHRYVYAIDATAEGTWKEISGSIVAGVTPWRHDVQDFYDNETLGAIYDSLEQFVELSGDMHREVTSYKFSQAAARPFFKEWLDESMTEYLRAAPAPVVKEILVENVRTKMVRVALPSANVGVQDPDWKSGTRAFGPPSFVGSNMNSRVPSTAFSATTAAYRDLASRATQNIAAEAEAEAGADAEADADADAGVASLKMLEPTPLPERSIPGSLEEAPSEKSFKDTRNYSQILRDFRAARASSEASFDLESYARNHDVGELVKDLQRLNQENGVQPQGSGQDHPGLHEALDSGLVSE